MKTYHIPVLVKEVIENISLKPGGIYVDGTVGAGGHSRAMLEHQTEISLFCFDQDMEAIRQAQKTLIPFRKNVHFFHDNYQNFRTRLALEKITKIDGILLDLGVSQNQIFSGRRGFSFMQEGPLDMRMNQKTNLQAWDLINKEESDSLVKIFSEYGEERYSRRIAQRIVQERCKTPINTTKRLAEIIEHSIPMQEQKIITKTKARIFQALRIAVNNELEILELTLNDCLHALNKGGRMLIISWHSLEDRMVKAFMRKESGKCQCPLEIPICVCNYPAKLKTITTKAIVPQEQEKQENVYARSAKLRVAERI